MFRLPPNDPYGDAWYCIGGGSRLLEADDHSRFDIHLAGISKLPPCEGGSSTASFEWMASDSSVTVTSDVAELAGADLDKKSRCFENRCRELDALGDFVSCPGEPLDEPTLDRLERSTSRAASAARSRSAAVTT